MSGMFITHRGAIRIDKADLYSIEPPEPTATWKPIKHRVLVDNLTAVLKSRGLTIRKEEYAIQRSGQVLFSVLDLAWGETGECYTALGLRTSNNKQFCIQIAVGARAISDTRGFHWTSPINIGSASRFRFVSPLKRRCWRWGVSPRAPRCCAN